MVTLYQAFTSGPSTETVYLFANQNLFLSGILFLLYIIDIIIMLASSSVAGLECTGPAGLVLHSLAKLYEFCPKILIFIQHISFQLTNQWKKWKQAWQVKGLQIASTTLMFDSLLNVLHGLIRPNRRSGVFATLPIFSFFFVNVWPKHYRSTYTYFGSDGKYHILF